VPRVCVKQCAVQVGAENPRAMAFTVTPFFDHSTASERVSDDTPPCSRRTAATSFSATKLFSEAMLMIRHTAVQHMLAKIWQARSVP